MVLAWSRGWSVICKCILCSKAIGFILQHPNLLLSCRENPPSNSAEVSEHKLSHQLGLVGVTQKYQRPCWWVREELSGVCPSNPRGKWNIVACCFRWLEFQVTASARHPTTSRMSPPAMDTYVCWDYGVVFFSSCHLKIATPCALHLILFASDVVIPVAGEQTEQWQCSLLAELEAPQLPCFPLLC